MQLTRLLFPVLLALPFSLPQAGAAEPVRVTTHLAGQMSPQPFILEKMGLGDYYNHPGGLLPFSLTINNVFDPDAIGPSLCAVDRCEDYSTPVSFTFTLDGKTLDFTDNDGVARVASDSSFYMNSVSYLTQDYPAVSGNYYVSIDTWLSGPAGSFAGNVLAPQDVHSTPDITGSVTFSALPVDSEVPGFYTVNGVVNSASLQVVSVVPEPAGTGMLAAGLAVLALAGRRSRTRRLQARGALSRPKIG
jgi:hypothetical protein